MIYDTRTCAIENGSRDFKVVLVLDNETDILEELLMITSLSVCQVARATQEPKSGMLRK